MSDGAALSFCSAEDELEHVRALASQAVKHQFDMLSGMFKIYRTKSLQMGFHVSPPPPFGFASWLWGSVAATAI